ncbi:hypothetical protein WQ57_06400 [Mesobacillus campisalis]|uniref:Uncharacterized protein n=1 Tax=Mesobacillus campisalis TaxID=1408103 RepID=A0A0M2SZ33_9BACI|nr:hypothetical protein WQ57_06400 [Mesobacillus campisalis]
MNHTQDANLQELLLKMETGTCTVSFTVCCIRDGEVSKKQPVGSDCVVPAGCFWLIASNKARIASIMKGIASHQVIIASIICFI